MADDRFQACIDPPWDFEAWRNLARHAVRADVAPERLSWSIGDSLFQEADIESAEAVHATPTVPTAFTTLARQLLCHSSDDRFGILYRLLWRISKGERALLGNPSDPLVIRASALAQQVRRDMHKMKAFVRFREIADTPNHFVAWFEPDHFIVDAVAPFFARRFTGMHWTILTPYRSARWDREALAFGAGASPEDAPPKDAAGSLWETYYARIFNPARLNLRMMTQEMPTRYWKNLPETRVLGRLAKGAAGAVREMAEREFQPARRKVVPYAPPASAEQFESAGEDFLLSACRACELFADATQAVPGEGPGDARVMLLGEQPGDQEDLRGRPFVGPAGQLLDRALADAGIDRGAVFLTNAVKHFRFERRGKLRVHKKPGDRHIAACRMWLQREVGTVKPEVIVCLGATATRALLGAGVRFADVRGRWLSTETGLRCLVTVHPAWILRQPAGETDRAYALLVSDLKKLTAA